MENKCNAGNNITELVFVLDKSGSMGGLESDTIGGFNAMIQKQKNVEGKVYVTTVLFSDENRVIHDRKDISEIRVLTEKEYEVGGCTALLDALGDTIRHIAWIHKYARPEDVPEHTIFVITTDGMENASRKYTSDEIRALIKKEEEKYGWEFLFLAANIDAVETAERYGIRRNRAADYENTSDGLRDMYDCVSGVVKSMRCAAPVADDWGKKLRKDRKKK